MLTIALTGFLRFSLDERLPVQAFRFGHQSLSQRSDNGTFAYCLTRPVYV
jgi:hypothetical protein